MEQGFTFPWNDTRRDFSLHRNPHEFIEEQVERTPDSPALVLGERKLSYRDLNSRANQLAHFLRQKGIGPDRLVGVCLDRSFDMLVAFLGILKAGGAYLPLDPKFPKQRLAFMLSDASVSILLTQQSLLPILPDSSAQLVLLDADPHPCSSFPSSNLPLITDSANLAYVIYTSGSTGNPKGVMIPRIALTNFLLSMLEAPGISSSDSWLAITTVSFDISILELLLPLLVGAQLVIATREQASDGPELIRLLERHSISILQATPTTWRMLLDSGWEGKSGLKVLCGGEYMGPDLAARLLPRCKELWNVYGPTETTIWSSAQRVLSPDRIFLNPLLANTQFYVVDDKMNLVPPGETGELLIGGIGLARGYLHRPELTAEKFVPDPWSALPGARLYHSGDLVRRRSDDSLECLGRLDHQVKLRGFRIELGEIESALEKIEGIRQAVVIVREDRPGDQRLVAYYTGAEALSPVLLLQSLKSVLPEYMLPASFLRLEQFPLTPNAKLDRKALPAPERKRPPLAQEFIAPRTPLETQLASLWCELLDLDRVGIDDSFFDLGGNSLAVVRMAALGNSRLGREIPPVKVFQYPTIAQLCRFLDHGHADSSFVADAEQRLARQHAGGSSSSAALDGVAVVGMVGRFPGADTLDQLWRNLCNSVESISVFTPEELGPGIDEQLRRDTDYIRARGLIEGADLFDAAFFGISPLEARVMDPQQRVFLELVQHALENAGYDPERFKGPIGVFAGIGDNHYYTTNLLTHPDLLAMAGKLAVEYGNQKDYIALRAAYLLDLRGPAVSLNTACSTTLLAIDQASRSLLDFECDLALAGGIDITVPQRSGFLYQEGGTFTRDGHCRPFDAEATGTMFCDGAGVVALKRLADAIADGDTIYAVLRGTGKNNNGARPASFLAPSVDGQAEAIAMAQARANVPVETIRYIEAHGTGTPVGDPIEIDALCKVFQSKTAKKQFCYVGSIKGNIGHPTNAAGVAGFIKAAMVLHREQIPPTLHFKTLNPKIDLAESPFLIADKLVPFPRGPEPRRTAVSSFGFGGTNVHAILEEAPLPRPGGSSRPMQLLLLSARTPAALDAYRRSLADHLDGLPDASLADASFTLQTGRRQMAQRGFAVAADPRAAAQLLRQPNPLRSSSKRCDRRDPSLVFLFGGQGTQYVNMGRNLYDGEPLFRAIVDDCCEFLKPHLGRDLRELLYPAAGDEKTAQVSLQDTFFTQPSIFVIEYALARFWQSLGIQPALMAGHSIGEFVAATLAGVWDLQDALRIIALRGRLMQSLPRGSMMAVSASAEKIAKLLPPSVQIASNNAPSLCVVSGPQPDVQAFQAQLEAQDIVCRHLHTSHAFHSAMMDTIVEPLRAEVAKVSLRAPSMPFVSTVTGRLITAAETTDPAYWAQHARATVEFSKAVLFLKEQGHDLFLECGPRSTLCALTRQHFSPERPCTAIPTLADTHEDNTEWASLLFALGSLWQNGLSLDWDAFYAHEDRRRIPLPGYPFERQRFWVDPAVSAPLQHAPAPQQESLPAAVTSQNIAASPAVAQESRKDRLASRLLDLLVPVCGRERSQLSSSSTFLEQGFDSLSLTQVSFAIRKEFGAKISFSQLMNQLPNAEMVAEHLDKTLPPDQFAASAPAPAADPLPLPAAPSPALAAAPPSSTASLRADGSRLEEIIAEQSRTIARLVGLLEKGGVQQPPTPAPSSSSVPAPASSPAPASAPPAVVTVEPTVPQRGIFFSSRLSASLSASYNESMTLRFTGAISVPKMTRALHRLVARHDALRASFDETGSAMRLAPSLSLGVPVTDLSSASDREERLVKIIALESARVFSLPDGPLFRSQIVLLGADSAAVIFTGHHVICDGWSLDVLIHDLCAFYSEELSGTPVELSAPGSYADYARDLALRSHSADFAEARAFWQSRFASGFPVLVLPSDRPRSARREFAARRIERTVPPSTVQKLRALAARNNYSFFTVILGALSLLLARVSRQRRFVLSLPTAEQPVAGNPGLVGHCVSLLPFLVDLRDGESVSSFLSRVQQELGAAHDHSAFTLVSLLQDLRPVTPMPGVSPVSAGLTSVKKFLPHELPQSGFSLDYSPNPKSFESFEWYLNAIEAGDSLLLHCHYDLALFKNSTAEEWLAALDAILMDIVADPSRNALELARLKQPSSPSAPELLYTFSSPDSSPAAAPSVRMNSPAASSSAGDDPALLERLLDLWRRVLHLRSLQPDDDFFALGGHSMLAAQLFARIERELGLTAPLALLYEASTPRKLARKLARGSAQADWQSLVPIQTAGPRIPLFLVHAAEGNVLLYRSLASCLGPDQPVYGLQSLGLDGQTEIDPRFEVVARRYIDELRQVQPQGPYMLGGYCLGGTIALEMARQLREAGQSVGLVAMIENFNVRAIPWPLPLPQRVVNRFFLNPYFHLRNLFAAEGAAKFHFFLDKLRVEISRARVSARVSLASAARRFRPGAAAEFHHLKIADLYDHALARYDVQPYPGELTVFLPERHLAGMGDRLGGWGHIAQGGARLYSLPISPKGSLIEPFVRQLALLLRASLDRAGAASPSDAREITLDLSSVRR